ncbi:hypothetical protein E2562_020862 [Oryza meyeriana var. granulata]|uniref:Uncharacterized protein n=1 Tax=Oryza meyeriana var. granulata TaxID=110450 RepID=A0A6G1D4W3_9ORYZ|nr:hypothetical protein E2562_020862 [Oryza meyeriana var. granulata]
MKAAGGLGIVLEASRSVFGKKYGATAPYKVALLSAVVSTGSAVPSPELDPKPRRSEFIRPRVVLHSVVYRAATTEYAPDADGWKRVEGRWRPQARFGLHAPLGQFQKTSEAGVSIASPHSTVLLIAVEACGLLKFLTSPSLLPWPARTKFNGQGGQSHRWVRQRRPISHGEESETLPPPSTGSSSGGNVADRAPELSGVQAPVATAGRVTKPKCVLDRSTNIQRMEDDLRRALSVMVIGSGQLVSAETVIAEVVRRFNIDSNILEIYPRLARRFPARSAR